MKTWINTLALFFTLSAADAQEQSDPTTPDDVICTTANGEKLLRPGAKVTTTIESDGAQVAVPIGMAHVPAGEFTLGTGPTARQVHVEAYCIGKYHVTNAEYKVFLDATDTRAPRYWKNGRFPDGRDNHPVAFVSLIQAMAYATWLSERTGWKYSLPTSEQWEKAARGPANTLYPWGNSMDVRFSNGVLTSKFNFNAVVAAKYLTQHPDLETAYASKSKTHGGQKTTVADITAFDESGRVTPFSISSRGQVRGWVAHSTNTGFIGTELFASISNAGGNTTPVGAYEDGKSGCGCYDMAGNVWDWCLTEITATNGAEKGKRVNEIRGGSWYATGNSCKSVSIGEGRAASGAYNTVGFRVVMLPDHNP